MDRHRKVAMDGEALQSSRGGATTRSGAPASYLARSTNGVRPRAYGQPLPLEALAAAPCSQQPAAFGDDGVLVFLDQITQPASFGGFVGSEFARIDDAPNFLVGMSRI
jgi:hypothetical protein